MKKRIAFILICVSLGCLALDVKAQRNTDRIVQTDSLGNKQFHLQQYVRFANKICPVDSIGNIEYHKGCTNVDPVLPKEEAKALAKQLSKDKK